MARQRTKKKPMSEINVVPYIDVMLVLLVIFMITAPFLVQGVDVALPQADAEPVEQQNEDPLIVSVTRGGDFYIDVGENSDRPVDPQTLIHRVAAVLKYKPKTPVLVRGDAEAAYGRVVEAMVLLQSAGVSNVGLVTEPPPPRQ